jgi:hypothetical protein
VSIARAVPGLASLVFRLGTWRTRSAGTFVAVVVACGFGLVLVSAASAATVTIGPSDVSGQQNERGCAFNPCSGTWAQLTQPTPGVVLTAPADGVITAWHVHGQAAGGTGGTLALRVLRRAPDGLSFTGVGTSSAVTATPDDGSPAHAVSIPVRAGDYIGVDTVAGGASVFITEPAGADVGLWSVELADGSTMPPASMEENARLMLNAVESLQPAVSSVSPSSGSTMGGEAVTIRGSNLDGATGVSFGGTPAGSFTASATQITATAPSHAQGTLDVRVTGPGGMSPSTGADLYSYLAPGVSAPSIAIASPANGGTYQRGHFIAASYSCTAAKGTTLTSCTGPVANGAAIDATTLGSHRFTVIAQDSDGGSATLNATYTIATVLPKPKLSAPSQTTRTWREANALPHASAKRKAPVGTTFSFALNEPARTTLSFTQHTLGRKPHHKCLTPTKNNRHAPRCTRTIPAGHLTLTGHPGTNKIHFAGRITHTNKLKPGQYTLTITATNPQHVRSAPRSLNFTIIK